MRKFLMRLHQSERRFFLTLFASAIIITLVVIDRVSWASISQWREDQSTSVWLGYVLPLRQLPVGLISSQLVPNPNGMLLFGYLLSRLPGLWAISTFLSIMQALLLAWLCWSWFGRTKLFLMAAAVLLSSAVLRAISIEFWNQWVILYLNLLFFIILARYNQRPDFSKIPILLLILISAPSLYLAGLANAIAFAVLFAFLFFATRARLDTRSLLPAVLIALVIIAISMALVWIPYFQTSRTSQVIGLLQGSSDKLFLQLAIAVLTLVGFIGWIVTWIFRLIPSVMFFDGNLLPASAGFLIVLHNIILVCLAFISIITLSFAALTSYKKNKNFSELFLPNYQAQGRYILLASAFILICFSLTPLLRGPFWILGIRMDMTIQFLPFFLLLWFVTPLVVQLPARFQQLFRRVSVVLAVVFVALNLVLGWMTVDSIRNYRGNALTPSDVPLFQKLQVVEFVAGDWASRSSAKEIPIYYDFSAILLPVEKEMQNYGIGYTTWYAAPYTLGRSMDYQLLRMYHLRNTQEGLIFHERKKDQAVYIVHYAFLQYTNPPGCYQDHFFGRLSVSVKVPAGSPCPSP